MKKLIAIPSLSECDLLKSVLESKGISCFIKNEMSSLLAGKIPFQEVMPELWIIDDEQFDKASAIVKKVTRRDKESRDD